MLSWRCLRGPLRRGVASITSGHACCVRAEDRLVLKGAESVVGERSPGGGLGSKAPRVSQGEGETWVSRPKWRAGALAADIRVGLDESTATLVGQRRAMKKVEERLRLDP